MPDIIIRSGTVVDGSGAPGRIADIAIENDRITRIGDLSEAEAATVIDARGLVVAPGFIDIHSHSDFTLLVDPRAQSSIAQGVTTEVIGNCGHGCAPIVDPALVTGNIYGYTKEIPLHWNTTAGYLERLELAEPAVNVVAIVPNGNLRIAAMGLEDRPSTPDERAVMTSHLEEGLDAGAFGFSTGLEYPSERATTVEETIDLCRVTLKAGGIYTTHTRNRDAGAVEAVEEALTVAKESGIPLQISHITPRKGGPPDTARRAIDAVDTALRDGLDVAFDMHTRLYGFTNLSAALPPSLARGSASEIAGRLRTRGAREEVRHFDSLIASFGKAGWQNVELFSYPTQPELAGRSIVDLAGPGGDPMDTIVELLAGAAEDLHAPMCVCHSYTEDELLETYQHPACTLGSDATALAVDGPLAQSAFPGAFTWASWAFRRFVRERQVFTVEEMVARFTSQPARRFGLRGRGTITTNAYADLAIFDPGTFGERGTMSNPNQLAAGMRHVLVNGVVTWSDGTQTSARGGRVLRRQTDGGYQA
ncbi:MAG: D-aminoacylase [Thermomicrobiales bacterium]|nr:D-aminoacylase [Thermomicrobiales bacterium]